MNQNACKACGQCIVHCKSGRKREYCNDTCRQRAHRNYDRYLANQGGVCAICGSYRLASGKERMALDHDHVSGSYRGVLCYQCNSGLGMFQDSILFLARAMRYLCIQGGSRVL